MTHDLTKLINVKRDHSLFGPSGAHRWTRCHGSITAELDYPNDNNEFTIEGTAAHLLGEMVLRSGDLNVSRFLGTEIEVLE